MDYKLESLKAQKQLAVIILKDHGDDCLCSECQEAQKAVFRLYRYEKLKAEMEQI